ncbi:hypothetical protein E5K00_13405 [Hymenobacter aquaticus]|uniref:Uncharacterized protein n=1 Tax=Hymenobacter aquaticus TaxID=1867101 RepID=A0A4Z0PUW6_9BACT|nr:hypothetical protein [Hymenobacter aquaticus]TGE21285.1 hypothetical protein E5K00_13405 [Hymenobacter aquaticus]
MNHLYLALISLIVVGGCKPIQSLPLPARCSSIESLGLTHREKKALSRFISEQNNTSWIVDIRRPDVCLTEVAATNHIGLIKIESTASSHFTAQYFIKGLSGISTIKQEEGQTVANVKAALAQHQGDFSPEEANRIISYFELK